MTGKARFVRMLRGWSSAPRLYKLTPAYKGEEYVVVSALPGETMIFAAEKDGMIKDWTEMGYVGYASHEDALETIGYEEDWS